MSNSNVTTPGPLGPHRPVRREPEDLFEMYDLVKAARDGLVTNAIQPLTEMLAAIGFVGTPRPFYGNPIELESGIFEENYDGADADDPSCCIHRALGKQVE